MQLSCMTCQRADDEVAHVIYAFYPDYEDTEVRNELDALRPLVESSCATSRVPCHFLDLRPTFVDHAEYLDASGVLPTSAGAEGNGQGHWVGDARRVHCPVTRYARARVICALWMAFLR